MDENVNNDNAKNKMNTLYSKEKNTNDLTYMQRNKIIIEYTNGNFLKQRIIIHIIYKNHLMDSSINQLVRRKKSYGFWVDLDFIRGNFLTNENRLKTHQIRKFKLPINITIFPLVLTDLENQVV